jgi:putative hydrolase of the HAD superfamily
VKALLVDFGGVLVVDLWPGAAADWAPRLGIEPAAFLSALFGGNEAGVLVGRTDEPAWWEVVGQRLGIGRPLLDELTADLARREVWDEELVAYLGRIKDRARVTLVSNAWPDTRRRIESVGGHGVLDDLVLSCEVGMAKPDPGIYELALKRSGVPADEALFVDDAEVNVAAARRLGLRAHRHTGAASTIEAIEGFLSRPG